MLVKNIIYCLRCPISNDIRYIGQTKRGLRRKYEHNSKNKEKLNTHLDKWLNKLQKNDLKPIFEVLESCECNTELNAREIYWISYYEDKYELCNYEGGGIKGKIISENHNSKYLKGKHLEDYYTKERANEIKSNISKSVSGENNPRFGEDVRNNKELMKKLTLSNSKVTIVAYDTILMKIYGIYINSKSAAKALNTSHSSVRMAKSGKYRLRRRYLIFNLDYLQDIKFT